MKELTKSRWAALVLVSMLIATLGAVSATFLSESSPIWTRMVIAAALLVGSMTAALLGYLSLYTSRKPHILKKPRIVGDNLTTSSELTPHRIERLLDLIGCIVPRRVDVEELGDLLEILKREMDRGRPAWHLWMRAIFGVFGVLIDAIRYCTSALRGRRHPK
jgi:hypothetical protein